MDKTYNCIVVFNKEKNAALFCKRQKEPYKGRYNFVGGKVEPGESSDHAAYRELQEETGITKQQIRLYHLMDIRYYYQNCDLEIYVGKLEEDISLREETNPLIWLSLSEDFTDRDRFAGEQNIAHIMNVAGMYPIDEYRDAAEDNLKQAIRSNSFNLKDRIDFFKKKWLKEHIAIMVFIGICIAGIFTAGLILKESLVCSAAILLLVPAHGWRNNAMMAYVEKHVYDDLCTSCSDY